jgi:hypothetical protein
MHADSANYHSNRYDRIRRICEDATTIRQQPSIQRSLFRLAWPPG